MKFSPSLAMKAFELFLRTQGKVFNAEGFPRYRTKIEQRSYPAPAPMPRKFSKLFRTQEQQVDGKPVFTIAPRHGEPAIHILYTHGGAYINALQWIHWEIIRKLVERLGARVTVPIYPLAPEHTYREAFAFLADVYRTVLQHAPDQPIVLCGDSAGGGFALAQAIHYRDLGLRLPDRLVLFSPWLDITMSNPDNALVEPRDIMLGTPGLLQCGQWWAGGDDPRSPLLSPLFGNLAGLPPMDVFMGTAELFVADGRKLKEKVSAIGGTVNLYEYPGAFHVFVGATITPESKDVFDRLVKTLGACRRAERIERG